MKEQVKNNLMKAFWVFFIASIIGCIVETIVSLVQKGHFEVRQGLLYGPFIPVYGVGAVFYFFTITKIKKTGGVFLASALLGGFVEYFFSYFQEKFFGTVSWDYSHLWFNLNGRTSLLHCLYWGTGGVLFVKFLYPYMNQLIDRFNKKVAFQCMSGILACFMFFNICISCVAADRQFERRQQIQATTSLDKILDQYYPDEVMDTIYTNKKERTSQMAG